MSLSNINVELFIKVPKEEDSSFLRSNSAEIQQSENTNDDVSNNESEESGEI